MHKWGPYLSTPVQFDSGEKYAQALRAKLVPVPNRSSITDEHWTPSAARFLAVAPHGGLKDERCVRRERWKRVGRRRIGGFPYCFRPCFSWDSVVSPLRATYTMYTTFMGSPAPGSRWSAELRPFPLRDFVALIEPVDLWQFLRWDDIARACPHGPKLRLAAGAAGTGRQPDRRSVRRSRFRSPRGGGRSVYGIDWQNGISRR